jgi:glycine cleavage system aminomethyltransferase T
MWKDVFAVEVDGPGAAKFLDKFCTDNLERARELGKVAQAKCKGNDEALIRLAGKLKYIKAHLELAQAYGKQIAIMSEHFMFRRHALIFIGTAYAELEALEYFEPV